MQRENERNINEYHSPTPTKQRVEKTSVEPEMTSLNHRGQQRKEAVLCSKSIVNLCYRF